VTATAALAGSQHLLQHSEPVLLLHFISLHAQFLFLRAAVPFRTHDKLWLFRS
jgi:hypothetical protein